MAKSQSQKRWERQKRGWARSDIAAADALYRSDEVTKASYRRPHPKIPDKSYADYLDWLEAKLYSGAYTTALKALHDEVGGEPSEFYQELAKSAYRSPDWGIPQHNR